MSLSSLIRRTCGAVAILGVIHGSAGCRRPRIAPPPLAMQADAAAQPDRIPVAVEVTISPLLIADPSPEWTPQASALAPLVLNPNVRWDLTSIRPTLAPPDESDAEVGRTWLISATIDVARFAVTVQELQNSDHFVAIHADPGIDDRGRSPGSSDPCETVEIQGVEKDLKLALGVLPLGKAGLDGEGTIIFVVDTGMNYAHVRARHPAVKFGSTFSWRSDGKPGAGHGNNAGHGTMCAYLATVAAPKATLADVVTFDSLADRITGANDAYRRIAIMMRNKSLAQFRGVVVTNSWTPKDLPSFPLPSPGCLHSGAPRRGFHSLDSPCHFLNRSIARAARRGVDFLFAAGNAGECASATSSSAMGTIRGPSSHPDVLTVSAVGLERRRLHNASQGPGTLLAEKPDVVSFANYSVSNTMGTSNGIKSDTNTSAATALAAGIVAALRSKLGRTAPPAYIRAVMRCRADKENLLRSNGDPIVLAGFDPDIGFGLTSGHRLAKLISDVECQ